MRKNISYEYTDRNIFFDQDLCLNGSQEDSNAIEFVKEEEHVFYEKKIPNTLQKMPLEE